METLFTGRNRIELGAIGSTNEYALDLLKNTPLPEGTVIITDTQLKGKGQRGNSWLSAPGKNITASFIFYPAFLDPSRQFLLSKVAALAIAAALDTLLDGREKVEIKWPNDIYVRGQKIAGILIENTLKQQSIASSVIGIGINVNQEDIAHQVPQAISLRDLKGNDTDLKQVLDVLCSFLEVYYLQLRGGKKEELDKAYLDRLYKLGMENEFVIQGQSRTGRILGLNEEGKLRVGLGGTEQEFGLKEISFS